MIHAVNRFANLDAKVLKLLRVHNTLTPIAAILGLSGITMRASIKRLMDSGKVEKVSERHGNIPAVYRVVKGQPHSTNISKETK